MVFFEYDQHITTTSNSVTIYTQILDNAANYIIGISYVTLGYRLSQVLISKKKNV